MKAQLIALAVAAIATSGAQAALFAGSSASNGNLVTDYSTGSLLSFDLDVAQHAPVTLNYTVEAGDLGGLDFNAIVRNLTGWGFAGASVSLANAVFGNVGGVQGGGFGSVASVAGAGNAASISFTPREHYEFYIGNPLGNLASADWAIDVSGLSVGDSFSITINAVPEPTSIALLLGALGMVAAGRRKG